MRIHIDEDSAAVFAGDSAVDHRKAVNNRIGVLIHIEDKAPGPGIAIDNGIGHNVGVIGVAADDRDGLAAQVNIAVVSARIDNDRVPVLGRINPKLDIIARATHHYCLDRLEFENNRLVRIDHDFKLVVR